MRRLSPGAASLTTNQNQEPNQTTPATPPAENPELAPAPPDGSAPTTQTDLVAEKKLREIVEAAIGDVLGAPSETRRRLTERVTARVVRTVAEIYRGPLPHPDHFRAYEDICPGASKRILAMAERAQKRREDRLDKAMAFEYQDRRIGLHYAFLGLLAFLIAGLIALYSGHDAVGIGLLSAAGIGTAVVPFIHGRRSGDKDKQATMAAPPQDSGLPSLPDQRRRLKRILDAILGR